MVLACHNSRRNHSCALIPSTVDTYPKELDIFGVQGFLNQREKTCELREHNDLLLLDHDRSDELNQLVNFAAADPILQCLGYLHFR